LYAKRDWGHAKDYVVAMWKMLQKKKPKDYIIASGKQYSVKDFANLVAKELNFKITWKGKGINEKGYLNKKLIISIDRRYFRPTEVESLLGNPNLARKELKWSPKFNINTLVKDMVSKELKDY
jgi:GDPmannose 4,6-dehydratase